MSIEKDNNKLVPIEIRGEPFFKGDSLTPRQAEAINDLLEENEKLKALIKKYRVYRDIDGFSHFDDGAKFAEEYYDWLKASSISINTELPRDINTFITFMTHKFNEFDGKEETIC